MRREDRSMSWDHWVSFIPLAGVQDEDADPALKKLLSRAAATPSRCSRDYFHPCLYPAMNPDPHAIGSAFPAAVAYPQGSPASAVGAALAAIGLTGPRPVLILVGGAANLDPKVAVRMRPLFRDLVPVLDRLGATVIDGGTHVGVMALMGEARHHASGRFPLIGIAPRGRVNAPARFPPAGRDETRVALDPHHSHFLLVPGERWGDESPWLTAAAERLASGRATLMLVAGGGEITRRDILHRLRQAGRILALAGSGGTADALVAWRRGEGPLPVDDQGVFATALVEVLDLTEAPGELPQLVAQALAS